MIHKSVLMAFKISGTLVRSKTSLPNFEPLSIFQSTSSSSLVMVLMLGENRSPSEKVKQSEYDANYRGTQGEKISKIHQILLSWIVSELSKGIFV